MPIAFLVVILAVPVVGCSTIWSTLKDRETLRDKIRSGTIVKPGDRVRVTTVNGDKKVITVTSVTREILSADEVVYIPDKVAWSRKESEAVTFYKETAIGISIDKIISLVSEIIYAERKTYHTANALMLAVFGFLIVLGWVLPKTSDRQTYKRLNAG